MAKGGYTEQRVEGRVVRVLPDKGFGFLADGSGTEYFFHRTAVAPNDWDQLEPQTAVTFVVSQGSSKGPRAESVQRREGA